MGIQNSQREERERESQSGVIGLYPLQHLIKTIQTDVIDTHHMYSVHAHIVSGSWEIIETRNNRQGLFHGIVFRKSLPVCFCFPPDKAGG